MYIYGWGNPSCNSNAFRKLWSVQLVLQAPCWSGFLSCCVLALRLSSSSAPSSSMGLWSKLITVIACYSPHRCTRTPMHSAALAQIASVTGPQHGAYRPSCDKLEEAN